MSARFRLNPRVFQMLSLVFAALALPIAMVVLGSRQMASQPPAPESPGLRASLELAADKCLPASTGLSGTRIVFPPSADDRAAIQKRVESAAADAGGNILAFPDAGEGIRLLVRIPSAQTARFEGVAFRDLTPAPDSQRPSDGLYEVIIPNP